MAYVQPLAALGIDVNQANKDGWTPLYRASEEGHTEVVKALLVAPGIDVNQANKDGWTPLYRASRQGRTEVVKALLASPGIAVNQANKDGKTPLNVARNQEIRALLLAAGARDDYAKDCMPLGDDDAVDHDTHNEHTYTKLQALTKIP